ncbi:hypothetical protein HPB51_010304 [Rhipicephalus microplus]|uniref:Uncharacterized protein n=1 Tax=Rhipicephalus microplus TaxID=6941 RepID=A0A9J6E0G0_RHIMP|nr:hypothetical protein HPB51_010304 [Rhipicephalus microplus]
MSQATSPIHHSVTHQSTGWRPACPFLSHSSSTQFPRGHPDHTLTTESSPRRTTTSTMTEPSADLDIPSTPDQRTTDPYRAGSTYSRSTPPLHPGRNGR